MPKAKQGRKIKGSEAGTSQVTHISKQVKYHNAKQKAENFQFRLT